MKAVKVILQIVSITQTLLLENISLENEDKYIQTQRPNHGPSIY